MAHGVTEGNVDHKQLNRKDSSILDQSSPDDSGYVSPPSVQQHSNLSYYSEIGDHNAEHNTSTNSSCLPANPGNQVFPLPSSVNLHNVLKTNFVYLKEELEPEIADILYQNKTITLHELEKVMEAKTIKKKNEILIKALASPKDISETFIINNVIQALEEKKCGDNLVKLFKEDGKAKEDRLCNKTQCDVPLVLKSLKKHSKVFEEEIEPRRLIDKLVVVQVLSLDEHTDIHTTNFKPERMKCLIKYILRNPQNYLGLFCDVLGEIHPDMLALLLQTEMETSTISTQIHTSIEGNLHIEDPESQGPAAGDWVKWNFEGEVRTEERMVVDDNNHKPNEGLTQEVMEMEGFDMLDLSFSSVKLNLQSLSVMGKLKFLERCRNEPNFQEKWIRQALSKKVIERLAKKGTRGVSFEIQVQLPARSEVECRCKITTQTIVTHFTSLENSMEGVRSIAEAFVQYSVLKQDDLIEIVSKPTTIEKNQRFLMKLLEMKDLAAVGICLFGKMLYDTKQYNILKLVEENDEYAIQKIEAKHIRQNYSFLLEHIEPRQFVDSMHVHLPRPDVIKDQVRKTEIRRDRCVILLEYIIKEGQMTTDWFVSQLEKKKMTYVLRVINPLPSNNSSLTLWKESIMSAYKSIIEEVDPKLMRQMFVERKAIKATLFDGFCKYPSRKTRAVWFMKEMVSSKVSVLQCFVDALEVVGYDHIVYTIKTHMADYKPCPRFSKDINAVSKEVTITGKLNLEYRHGDADNSYLQRYIHDLLNTMYESNESNDTELNEGKMESNSPISTKSEKATNFLETNAEGIVQDEKQSVDGYLSEKDDNKPRQRNSLEINAVSKDVTIMEDVDCVYSHADEDIHNLLYTSHESNEYNDTELNEGNTESNLVCLSDSPISTKSDKVTNWLRRNSKDFVQDEKPSNGEYLSEKVPLIKRARKSQHDLKSDPTTSKKCAAQICTRLGNPKQTKSKIKRRPNKTNVKTRCKKEFQSKHTAAVLTTSVTYSDIIHNVEGSTQSLSTFTYIPKSVASLSSCSPRSAFDKSDSRMSYSPSSGYNSMIDSSPEFNDEGDVNTKISDAPLGFCDNAIKAPYTSDDVFPYYGRPSLYFMFNHRVIRKTQSELLFGGNCSVTLSSHTNSTVSNLHYSDIINSVSGIYMEADYDINTESTSDLTLASQQENDQRTSNQSIRRFNDQTLHQHKDSTFANLSSTLSLEDKPLSSCIFNSISFTNNSVSYPKECMVNENLPPNYEITPLFPDELVDFKDILEQQTSCHSNDY